MNCKNCSIDLDGGDIFMVLKAQDPNADPVQVIQYAYKLGWTTQNKRHFNKALIRRQPAPSPPIIICPVCKTPTPLADDSIAVAVEE